MFWVFLIEAGGKFSLPHNPILSLAEAKQARERKWEAQPQNFLNFLFFDPQNFQNLNILGIVSPGRENELRSFQVWVQVR